MTGLLRFLSFLIGVGGVGLGLYLVVQAQPAEVYGEANMLFATYGFVSIAFGLFWSLLGMAVAEAVEKVQLLYQPEVSPDTAETSDPGKPPSDSESSEVTEQDVDRGAGDVLLIMVLVVVVAIVLITTLVAG